MGRPIDRASAKQGRRGSRLCRRRQAAPAAGVLLAAVLVALAVTATAGAHVPGTQVWVRTLGSAVSPATGEAVAVGADGEVYLAGGRTEAGKPTLLTRYDASGRRRWTATWRSPLGTSRASAVAISPSGDAYVAGGSENGQGGNDIVLLKYSSAGKRLWARWLSSGPGLFSGANALVVDPAGNAYVVGDNGASGGLGAAVVFKYGANGALRWVRYIDQNPSDPQSGSTYGEDIALDGDGNVYVAATTTYASSRSSFVAKFAGANGADLGHSGGTVIFGTESGAAALAVRGAEVVLAGWYKAWDEPDSTVTQMLVERYDKALHYEWSVTAAGAGRGASKCNDVAIDKAGNVYAAGATYDQVGADTRSRAALLKVTPDGKEAWKATYVPGTKTESWAFGVAVAGGNAYITGGSQEDAETIDFLTIKYSAAGVRKWTKQWTSSGPGKDFQRGLALGPGCVFVGGTGRWGSGASIAVIVKYAR